MDNINEFESKGLMNITTGNGIIAHSTITESGSATVTNIPLGKYKAMDLYFVILETANTHSDTLNFYVDFNPSIEDDDTDLWINVCHFNVIYGDTGAKVYHLLLNSMTNDGVEDVTNDCNAGSYRKTIFSNKVRVRYTVTDSSGNASFKYELHYAGRD